jgi:hypothetical protein
MKKQIFTTIFILTISYSFGQNYFSTTSSNLSSNLNLSHLGTFSLGHTYEGLNDPWRAGEGRLLELYKPSGNVSLRLGSAFGKLSFNIAGRTGSFFPSATKGDIVIRKHTAKKVYFSLNNTTNDGNHAFIFGDSSNRQTLSILNNGRVGIGTLTPDTELSVNGTIHAKKVKVDLTGWSDFVFEKEYNLPTLKEVENYINKNGHLKDIPSEKEVVKNGIDVAEMNSKLLQKVEELMLYTIEQQKQIEKMKSEIEELKNK